MSFNAYPVILSGIECNDYTVKVNGKTVVTDTARVSAMPHNRRWPGHQRSLDQTETVQFLSLETDEAVDFEIIPKEPFDSERVRIRPTSLGIKPTVVGGAIRFTLPRAAYITVEPYGRHRALHIFADPTEDNSVKPDDEGVIYFGPGTHEVGMLRLESGQTVFIDRGAVVYACIHATDAENIRIIGRGILDNSHNKEQILFEANAVGNTQMVVNAKRLHTVQLEYCTNVTIDGITIRDSLVYNIRPIGCKKLNIRNVKIIGCWRYNSDGIDMHNCEDVVISNCFIRTFDDSVCIKGFDFYARPDPAAALKEAVYHNGGCYDVFKNALVEKCVIWNDWGKSLEIGAETRAREIANITFRDCDVIHFTGTALDCMNVDNAEVHDVSFSNITVEADEIIPAPQYQNSDDEKYVNELVDADPDILCVEVLYHEEYSKGTPERGRNKNITFEKINILGDRKPKGRFSGFDPDHKTENVRISNLTVNGVPVRDISETRLVVEDHTEGVTLSFDPYFDIKKNSVSSENQLPPSSHIKFFNPEGKGVRVLFLGNSITLHGVAAEIGWYSAYGMAASSEDKDYVHILMRMIKEITPDPSFCICQGSAWERSYKEGNKLHGKYEAASRFGADIIVMRLVENCPFSDPDGEAFRRELGGLLDYLDSEKKAKPVITTGFWHHPLDGEIERFATEGGYPLVRLGDLGEDDRMKAVGLFDHEGVAAHPGDLGMQAIAERIFEKIRELIV